MSSYSYQPYLDAAVIITTPFSHTRPIYHRILDGLPACRSASRYPDEHITLPRHRAAKIAKPCKHSACSK